MASWSQPFCLASIFPLCFSAFLRGWELSSGLSELPGESRWGATAPHASPQHHHVPSNMPSYSLPRAEESSPIPECGRKYTELFRPWFEFLPYAGCANPGKLLAPIKS